MIKEIHIGEKQIEHIKHNSTSAAPSVRLYLSVVISFQWLDSIGCLQPTLTVRWDPFTINPEIGV